MCIWCPSLHRSIIACAVGTAVFVYFWSIIASKQDIPLDKKAEEAKKFILEESPELQIYILPEDSMMTMDYRTDRVRIFIDENQIVVKPPKVG
ncbi:subtilisin-chymotrypsin inhibitor-2B-like [Anneissia japonica]|uniref:subtilisin-chymotrypsin inhibitor-2B-like n=1 Tax=Anneissia japonica TaxID=1529436 RepID=UPI00142589A1|nr:subtilisin-chymotrypsin inhibitor-2B-like [Anneissia japonica]